jgi:hypothetical protein
MPKFKLTDVEGKEHILELDQTEAGNVKAVFLKPVTPKPEIKVGMWVKFLPEIAEKLSYLTLVWDKEMILRVDRIDNNGGRLWFDRSQHPFDNSRDFSNDIRCFIPATPAEIEAHLKKVCEKYIGKRVRDVVFTLQDSKRVDSLSHPTGSYVAKYDQFWGVATNSDGICLYASGKFAEILPDKKKKPETREEFEKMLDEYIDVCEEKYIADFLNQYEL